MNWYKKAQSELTRMEDRNNFNDRIKVMEETVAILSAMAVGIHQDPFRSKKVIFDMAQNKFFSSFPNWQSMLLNADAKVLDNHTAASEMVSEVANGLMIKIHSMKQQRSDFLGKEYPINFKDKMDKSKERLLQRKNNG
jgi:hypothetical protein